MRDRGVLAALAQGGAGRARHRRGRGGHRLVDLCRARAAGGRARPAHRLAARGALPPRQARAHPARGRDDARQLRLQRATSATRPPRTWTRPARRPARRTEDTRPLGHAVRRPVGAARAGTAQLASPSTTSIPTRPFPRSASGWRPSRRRSLLDVGCNTGKWARLCLERLPDCDVGLRRPAASSSTRARERLRRARPASSALAGIRSTCSTRRQRCRPATS